MIEKLQRLLETLTPQRVVWAFCYGLVLAVVSSLVGATLSYELHVLQTSEMRAAYPPILYGVMPSPDTSPEEGAPGAAGGDFSQVYTSALALRHGESAYFPTTPEFADRFGRPSGYPPLMNWLAVPLSLLPYYDAMLLHDVASLIGLFAVSAWVLWKMGLRRHIGPVLLAQSSLYFLTPIGFTHLERGQFDLLVAVAVVLCVACAFMPRGLLGMALVSGFLGTLKWTSAPFLGCFSVVGFLFAAGRRRWVFPLIPLLMALGTALFWREVIEYWSSIVVFEVDAKPRGITFQHYLPRSLAKVLPVVVTLSLLGLAWLRSSSSEHRERMLFALSAPLSIVLMNLATCYGTISYEYHTCAALGIVPGLVVWLEREPSVSHRLKALWAGAYALLLCIAFRTFDYDERFDFKLMTRVYAVFSLLFFALCVHLIWGPLRNSSAVRAEAARTPWGGFSDSGP